MTSEHFAPQKRTIPIGALGSSQDSSFFNLGHNVWKTARAEKVAILVDAAAYFRQIQMAFEQAQREIWIVGWDFDPDILIDPAAHDPQTLSHLLERALDRTPDLRVRILVWAFGPLYSGKSLKLFRKRGILSHERVTIAFDLRHPFFGSHHQKLVTIDAGLGFVGGMDLTARRWDDSDHRPDNPMRVTPDGKPYDPVHDVQAAVSGPATQMIRALVRRRWYHATGEVVEPVETNADQWPASLPADFSGCQTALSRTEPHRDRLRSRRESINLIHDVLRQARKHIYIEAQYLASFGLAEVLLKRLYEEDGPEIVVVVTRSSHGLIEKLVMGDNRDRLIRKLKRADRHDRLWVMYPVVPDTAGAEREILVHSKVLIVDDLFLRVGSSNLNRRSEGLDTEADFSIEGRDDGCRKGIASVCARLLAEHLASTPSEVHNVLEATGSLRETIRRLNRSTRGLRHFDIDLARGPTQAVAGTALADPRRPFHPIATVRGFVERVISRLFGLGA
ncbi:Cardiolipin synthase B [Ensifer adhaerens]|uniref:phospholipase D-like domain-containing protein n=1 Tax=Ensifer adhaerens TaxID=106592 RepID=UPI0015687E3B|nr:phospholipase D-like domain-containing protein [Ensifer adhaerens]NRP21847.1 Cardiolipin synthase B [Ensifer adhaerens]